jgi:hypothetical protein
MNHFSDLGTTNNGTTKQLFLIEIFLSAAGRHNDIQNLSSFLWAAAAAAAALWSLAIDYIYLIFRGPFKTFTVYDRPTVLLCASPFCNVCCHS